MTQVFSWNLRKLRRTERFFDLAQGYLDCSKHLFRSLEDEQLKKTFSHAQAAAFLFEHSLELFLKGAIIQARQSVTNTHILQQLYNEFRNLYPGKNFRFEGSIEEIVGRDASRPYPEYSRYPIDTSGNLWPENSHFEFEVWLEQLELFQKDYSNLIPLIKERYPENPNAPGPY